MGMKINIGSGFKRIEGFLNVDDDPLVSPDFLVNLEKDKLPFEDNSVESVIAHHILEHIGDNFIPLMQEIYRVCSHGAIIDIKVPHHFHEVYYGDPTHKRPITVNGMLLFDKKRCEQHILDYGSSTGMALKYKVDFEMIWFDYLIDPFYSDMVNAFKKRHAEGATSKEEDWAFERLMREATNVAQDTMMKLVVKKE